MDLAFSAAEETFRADLRRWLDENIPAGWGGADLPEFESLEAEVSFLRDWQRRLADGCWVGIHWPREYGGRGATVVENFIFQEEMAAARAPEVINRIGVNLVGPTLIAHGTEEQKQRYLRRILTAEDVWCQLFSEPNAGSDLTSLRTRAERRGDEWVLSGQKVWTSYAQFARWGICLARTDPSAPKHKGIGYFIIDMQAPGVSVRPLRQLTGSDEFNEVFLEEVRVPADHLIGEATQGWQIAQTTLAHERGTAARQLVIHRILLEDLIALAREDRRNAMAGASRGVVAGASRTLPPASADLNVRQRLAQHWIEVEIMKLTNWRTLTRILRRQPLGPEGSCVKLFWSEMSQAMHDTAMDLMGPFGLLATGSPHAVRLGRLQRSYLYYRAATIFAGTSEIQRNIIAQRILGLPRG
jgi:alkylation response protein AidB-like acyl-CoA dehydrogenase